MIHLVVGLFKNTKEAGVAIAELKASRSSKDISLISKDESTGRIHIHQVKEIQGEEEIGGANKGIKIGMVGGILIGLFMITNPEFSSMGTIGALAAAFGVGGATLGAIAGAFAGSLNQAGLPPERAKMYKDKIKKGEVFVSVSTIVKNDSRLTSIFRKFHASEIHSMNNDA